MSIAKLDDASYASKWQNIENWLANAKSEPNNRDQQQFANMLDLRMEQAMLGLGANERMQPLSPPSPGIQPANEYDLLMAQFLDFLKMGSIIVLPPQSISPVQQNVDFDNMLRRAAFGSSVSQQTLYGRKVFLGGLPIGISSDEVLANFDRFGKAHIDWPHRDFHENTPPHGYAFVIYEDPRAVNALIDACAYVDYKYTFGIRSADGSKRNIEIKPWEMKNNELALCNEWHQYERLAVFIGGLPRTITAGELANILQEDVGGVAYVGIEVDEKTDYPKGAAKVLFNNPGAYVKAIAVHDLTIVSNGQQRLAEIKPFLHPRMKCELCGAAWSTNFCPLVRCLKYYCSSCWIVKHSAPGMESHKPMKKSRPHFNGGKKSIRSEASRSLPQWYQSSDSSSLESLLMTPGNFFNAFATDPRLRYGSSFGPSMSGTSPGISPYSCFSTDSVFDFPKH